VSEPYDIQVATGAARAIQEKLPEGVAAAVIEFITGSLIAAPRRVGKPLRRELAGLYSARRGTFRVLYRIDDAEHLVTVVRVEHRADAYRRR
jgi:mRNA-degrading endonuclease RelE of RelBE toxin-antitoxin system